MHRYEKNASIIISETVIAISFNKVPEKESIIKKGKRKIPNILLVRNTIKIYVSVAR